MSVDYKGLLLSAPNPLQLVEAIKEVYGGEGPFSIDIYENDSFRIRFRENYTPAQMAMSATARNNSAVSRQMSVFIGEYYAHDYKDVTAEPVTCIHLGHYGDAVQIINALVNLYGGFTYDDAGDQEWHAVAAKETTHA